MNFQNLRPSFFTRFKSTGFLSNNLILGLLVVLFCYYGCGTARNTNYMDLNELKVLSEPPPRRPRLSEFGDIPQVRTYVKFMQKLENKEPLSLNEVMEFLAADSYLYPSQDNAALLKRLEVIAAEKAKKGGSTD